MNKNSNREPTDEDEAAPDLGMLFSLRKPQHAGAGLVSGAKSIAKGCVAGAVGLIVAPAIGASQEGFKGFAKGLGAGIAGAVLLPAAGVVVGTTQVVRGIANTPEAIKEGGRGKTWDKATRTWIEDAGTTLIVDIGAAAHLRGARASDVDAPLSDYYGLLGVAKDASAEEIKRAYYLGARRLHPGTLSRILLEQQEQKKKFIGLLIIFILRTNKYYHSTDKNPNDPEAHERFQALAQAYQVLGNAELRQRYDAHGINGLDVNFVDGAEFFAALFGSDKFEHLVGELILAAAARAGPDLKADGLRQLQVAREARLATLLTALLRRYVEGDETGFRQSMQAEAAELAKVSYGEAMLRAIGKAYETQASIELGGVFEGSFMALKAQGRNIKSQFRAGSLAIKVMQARHEIGKLEMDAQRAQRAAEEMRRMEANGASMPVDIEGAVGDESVVFAPDAAALTAAATAAEAERVKAEEASLPLMLDAMWAANVLDIESTLKHVCKTVLKGEASNSSSNSSSITNNSTTSNSSSSISKAHRRRMAEALLELGLIFKAAKGETTTAVVSAKDRVEEAMMKMAEKRAQA